MSSEWSTRSFGDLVDQGVLEIGDGYRAKNDELGGGGLMFLRAGHVKDTHIDFDGVDRFLRTDDSGFSRKIAQPGDVVITTKGNSTGRIAYVTGSMPAFVYSPHLSYWRSNAQVEVHQGFLRAWAKSHEFFDQLAALSRSTDMAPYLSLSDQRRLRISLPPHVVQCGIGALNDTIFDRIALLRETNATLEAIAQALFKSWFVDFDPVRAKQQGLAPAGMDEATANLFSDGFEESALGLVPRGWKWGTLGDLADLNFRSWSARHHPERVQYLDLSNVKDNEVVAVTEFAFDAAPSRARRVLRSGDTIVGTVRPGNRSFAFIHEPAPDLTASTGFAVLSPRVVDNTAFVYLAATQDPSIDHLSHVADGGAYPAVRPDVVSALSCVVPSAETLRAFNAVTCPLLVKVSANQRQAQTLATLRDTLLPRLISGQLRLPEAEAALETA